MCPESDGSVEGRVSRFGRQPGEVFEAGPGAGEVEGQGAILEYSGGGEAGSQKLGLYLRQGDATCEGIDRCIPGRTERGGLAVVVDLEVGDFELPLRRNGGEASVEFATRSEGAVSITVPAEICGDYMESTRDRRGSNVRRERAEGPGCFDASGRVGRVEGRLEVNARFGSDVCQAELRYREIQAVDVEFGAVRNEFGDSVFGTLAAVVGACRHGADYADIESGSPQLAESLAQGEQVAPGRSHFNPLGCGERRASVSGPSEDRAIEGAAWIWEEVHPESADADVAVCRAGEAEHHSPFRERPSDHQNSHDNGQGCCGGVCKQAAHSTVGSLTSNAVSPSLVQRRFRKSNVELKVTWKVLLNSQTRPLRCPRNWFMYPTSMAEELGSVRPTPMKARLWS